MNFSVFTVCHEDYVSICVCLRGRVMWAGEVRYTLYRYDSLKCFFCNDRPRVFSIMC